MRSQFCGAALAAFFLAAPLPAFGADAGQQYRVLPPGEVSCGSWTRGRELAGKGNTVFLTQDGVSRAEREGWIQGYFSALNVELLPANRGARRDLTEGIDRDALMAMIDQYCAENPLDSLLGATSSIGATLVRGWLAAHPANGASATAGANVPAQRPAIRDEPLPPRVEAPVVVQVPPPAPEPLPPLAPPAVPPRAPEPPPAAVVTVAPPPPAPTPAIATAMPGAAFLQVGAYRTREAAAAAWAALRARYPEVTVALGDDVQEINLGERGSWYRLRIGPFGNADAANVTCNLLKAQGGDCFTVKP